MKILDLNNQDHSALTETYQDRVRDVSDAIIDSSQRVPLKKPQILDAIERQSRDKDVPELRFKGRQGSRAWPDFVKDVLAELKGKVVLDRRRGPSDSATAKRAEKEKLLSKISMYIEDAIGQAFPDGDPVDILVPKLLRLGIDEFNIGKWLDDAVRSHLGAKSFNAYMGNIYDDMAADSPEMMLQSGLLYNPYTNRPFNFLGQLKRLLDQGNNDGLLLNIIANVPTKDPKTVEVIKSNHEKIIIALLKLIRANGNRHLINSVMRNIEHMGLRWQEFDAIRQSFAADVREHMLPGDVLMIENEKQAVVGTILSIDSDTVIIEGEVVTKILNEVHFKVEISRDVQNTIQDFLAEDEDEALDMALDWASQQLDGDSEITARILREAQYHGREVKLGKPMRGDVKKYKVYVKDPKTGNIKKVNFGDKSMEIKRDDPARRKSFRARHGCGTPRASNRTKAAYWSCRLWSSKPVSKILKGKRS